LASTAIALRRLHSSRLPNQLLPASPFNNISVQ
jgi:hypothetical protein